MACVLRSFNPRSIWACVRGCCALDFLQKDVFRDCRMRSCADHLGEALKSLQYDDLYVFRNGMQGNLVPLAVTAPSTTMPSRVWHVDVLERCVALGVAPFAGGHDDARSHIHVHVHVRPRRRSP